MKYLSHLALIGLIPASVAGAQFAGAVGASARGTTSGTGPWQTSGQLSSAFRFDAAAASVTLDQTVEQHAGTFDLTAGSVSATFASPSANGFRFVASSAIDRDRMVRGALDDRAVDGALSYRRGTSGAWLGAGAQRFSAPAVITGLWHQLGRNATVSVSSSIRGVIAGARPSSYRTVLVHDSIFSDSGWIERQVSRTYGDSGSPGHRVPWAETEGRLSWTVGPLALDGVLGYRQRFDSVSGGRWMAGYATLPVGRGVALNFVAGSGNRGIPYSLSSGKFAALSLRFAPATLTRPRDPAQITPAATSFAVHRNAAGEYVFSIRLPRARVVEISGEFNGWHPVKLEQVRSDVWELALPIAPGSYRMNLRVDGDKWIAPPGTTAVKDEFNGEVGLVVIR